MSLREIIAFFKVDVHKIDGYLRLKKHVTKNMVRTWLQDLLKDLDKLESLKDEVEQKQFWIADWEENEAYNERLVVQVSDVLGKEKE